MQRLLKLQHHKHTGKILAHHHTSYRALLVVCLVVGACMFGLQRAAYASEYDVSATVPAALPSLAPTIDSPLDGAVVLVPAITVSGTCEYAVPAIAVTMTSNGIARGSALCAPDGTYSISVALFDGVNAIQATPVNITYQSGPASAAVTVRYNPPLPPPAPVVNQPPQEAVQSQNIPTTTSISQTGTRLELKSSAPIIVYTVGAQWEWELTITGGRNPYRLRIDWGDGKRSEQVVQIAGTVKIGHRFDAAGTYQVSATIVDATGTSTTLTSVAVSPLVAAGPTVRVQTASPGFSLGQIARYPEVTTMAIAYSVYVTVLGVLGVLWAHAHVTLKAASIHATVHTKRTRSTTKRVVTQSRRGRKT